MTYRADDCRLFCPAGRLLLGGSPEVLPGFAAALNDRPPADDAALCRALRNLIEGAEGYSFAPYGPLDEPRQAPAIARRQTPVLLCI